MLELRSQAGVGHSEVGRRLPDRGSSVERVLLQESKSIVGTERRSVWLQVWEEGNEVLQDLGHKEKLRLHPYAVRSS